MSHRIEQGFRGRFRRLLVRHGVTATEEQVEAAIVEARETRQRLGVDLARALAIVFDELRARLEGGRLVAGAAANGSRGESPPRFVCDGSLGGLARWLRAAGYEALAVAGVPAATLVEPARREGRVLLTSDSRFMERNVVRRGEVTAVWVSSAQGRAEQLAAVLLDLGLPVREPRCMACGGELKSVSKDDVQDRIPPRTARWKDEYFVCTGCDQLFWRGTHWERIRAQLAELLLNGATEAHRYSGQRRRPMRRSGGL